MSDLSSTVATTRKLIIGFVIFVVLVLIVQAIRDAMQGTTIPVVPNTGTTTYLPPTKTKNDYVRYPLNSLETLNTSKPEFLKVNDFEVFPDTVNVYKIREKEVLLSPLQNAREQAETLELNPNYETLEPNLRYRWRGGPNNLTMDFNTRDRSLLINSDLSEASKNPIDLELEDEQLISTAKSILGSLDISIEEIENAGRVDYIVADRQGNIQSVEKEDSKLARVTLYKRLESSTLRAQPQGNVQSTPKPGQIVRTNVISEVKRPDIISGSVTMILNGEGKGVESLVWMEYYPHDYQLKLTTPTPQGGTTNNNSLSAKYDIDVYATIEMGTAFNMVQTGADGAYLVYLSQPGENLFDPYIPLSVTKFTVDAKKTKMIYIEPEEYEFLEEGKVKTIYPYYWFEGLAQLENGQQADFVFLVDAIPR